MKNYDKDNIAPKTFDKAKAKFIALNSSEDDIKRKSMVAAVIYVWVEAVLLCRQFMLEEEERKNKPVQTQMSL